ncbi:MAG: alpha/beta fold hydrolase [Saprospiraceae bacterium]|nr:alpha/beta fold hydrolase [Saprospiraceae bacterium]MCB9322151.1 alpha/beta fold hydrolase [Lewinellaceae bacterium]
MSKFRTRFRKVLRIIGIVFFILLAFVFFAMHFLMPFRESDKKIEKYFAEKHVPVVIHHVEYQGAPVRFIETKGSEAPDSTLIIFVHGAPGSLSDHKAFLADSLLLSKARMVSMDRLGYGYSHYGQSVPGIGEQAAFIKFIVEQFPHKKVILCGHSFGGPIVAKFAMDYPELADKVIMLAPLNEPETEPMFNMAYLAKWKLTRWTLPAAINVSADEKFAHAAELEKMKGGWANLKVPMVHIHGTKDMLAPFSNVKFSEDHIPAALLQTIVLEGANHFLPWSHYELVRKVLLESI